MTLEIQYTEGLTVIVTATVDPGDGQTWKTGNPWIDWGDLTPSELVTGSGNYTHTYASAGTYTIILSGENDCDAIGLDTVTVDVIDPICNPPTCTIALV